MAAEERLKSMKDYAAMLTTFIHAYNDVINSYVLDFFVEQSWEKLPNSWQNVLEKCEPCDIGNFLDASHELQLTEVWPLSLQAFRKTAFLLAFPRHPITSSAPVKSFLQKALQRNPENFANFSWESAELEFKSNSCQHQNLQAAFRKNVKPKKQHEIFRLSQVVGSVLQSLNINHIVDVGSGVGHLSRIFCFEYNLRVATIDAVSSHTSAAKKFDQQALVTLNKQCNATNDKSGKEKCLRNVADTLPQHLEGRFTLDTTKEHLNKVLQQVWCDCDKIMLSLMGLHTCGDLSATLLKLFVEEAQAQVLFSVSCCYMKLNENTESQGYPLSTYIKALPHSFLSYEARELCCHALEGYIKRLKENSDLLKIHCYRAVLEKVIVTHDPHSRHIGLQSVKNAEKMKFSEYAVKALSKCPLKITWEDLTSSVNDMLLEEWKKVLILYSIRLLIAPVIETLILLDRMIFLSENGCSSCLFPIFEPSLSPRNHLLLSVKTSVNN